MADQLRKYKVPPEIIMKVGTTIQDIRIRAESAERAVRDVLKRLAPFAELE